MKGKDFGATASSALTEREPDRGRGKLGRVDPHSSRSVSASLVLSAASPDSPRPWTDSDAALSIPVGNENEAGSSAADVEASGSGEGPMPAVESVGERQGRQPASLSFLQECRARRVGAEGAAEQLTFGVAA